MKFKNFLYSIKIEECINSIHDDAFQLNNYQKELFKLVINEKAMMNVSKKILDTALKFLCKKFGLKTSDFDYIGYSDLSFVKKGAKLLQFNIIKKGEPNYMSTVAYKYNGV